jgi:L-glyceraldehyde 3-phosphate reductase
MTLQADEYQAAPGRYEAGMPYRRVGRSGLDLPAISLGLWHNFGDDVPLERQQATLRRAFDRGVTHFDLANNYGPPYGSAERNFGTIFARDFSRYRDELIISSKAGYDMWPGPYGQGGGSRKYRASPRCDQSLQADGLRLRRHFLQSPIRRVDSARWRRIGALDTRGALRAKRCMSESRPTRGDRTREAVGDPARDGHATADPPAVVLDAQPVGRGGPARRLGRRGRRWGALRFRRSRRGC